MFDLFVFLLFGSNMFKLRFERCCEQAYEDALELAAWCGGYDVNSLKSYYQESCGQDWFGEDAVLNDGEEEEQEAEAIASRLEGPCL